MKLLLPVFFSLFVIVNNSVTAGQHKIIYGTDNRMDYFEASDNLLKEVARSTVSMMTADRLSTRGQTTSIYAKGLGDFYGLCTDQPFFDQPSASDCSGFLVGPKTIVTAGHCVLDQEICEKTKFVFDYMATKPGQSKYKVPTSSVYECKKLVKSVYNNYFGEDGNDYAVIELDREVTDRQPLKFRKSGRISSGDEVALLGYPSGLPLKIAAGGFVNDNSNNIYFSTDLDAFGGNSGSAVVNTVTGEVEGILVRGGEDYVETDDGCLQDYVCTGSDCDGGEDVTRITAVSEIMDL